MRVLVYGGRDYKGRDAVFAELDRVRAESGVDLIIEGGATGADQHGQSWARSRAIACLTIPADWKAEPRAAGPLRNERMIEEGRPDVGLEFPGGAGTADMRRRLQRHLIPIIECPRPAGPPPQGDLFG